MDGLRVSVSIYCFEFVLHLHPAEFSVHFALIVYEALIHVARASYVHSRLPEIQYTSLPQVAFSKCLGGYIEVEHSIGDKGYTIHTSDPVSTNPAYNITCHESVDISIGKDQVSREQ